MISFHDMIANRSEKLMVFPNLIFAPIQAEEPHNI